MTAKELETKLDWKLDVNLPSLKFKRYYAHWEGATLIQEVQNLPKKAKGKVCPRKEFGIKSGPGWLESVRWFPTSENMCAYLLKLLDK